MALEVEGGERLGAHEEVLHVLSGRHGRAEDHFRGDLRVVHEEAYRVNKHGACKEVGPVAHEQSHIGAAQRVADKGSLGVAVALEHARHGLHPVLLAWHVRDAALGHERELEDVDRAPERLELVYKLDIGDGSNSDAVYKHDGGCARDRSHRGARRGGRGGLRRAGARGSTRSGGWGTGRARGGAGGAGGGGGCRACPCVSRCQPQLALPKAVATRARCPPHARGAAGGVRLGGPPLRTA
mmetsp:Transcript_12471/g.37390  ORF Transcript_12471/g.37390 Transcript_12471/m.37390 type:complete len:240 (-) Transcript_12471:1295-2014(-)